MDFEERRTRLSLDDDDFDAFNNNLIVKIFNYKGSINLYLLKTSIITGSTQIYNNNSKKKLKLRKIF